MKNVSIWWRHHGTQLDCWQNCMDGFVVFCCGMVPSDSIYILNTLRPIQNGRHFPDDIFQCIFLNENVLIAIKISLKFVAKGPINHIPALVQIMAWRRPGDKPLSEPTMIGLPMHICVTRPQWVKSHCPLGNVVVILNEYVSNSYQALISWAFPVKMPSGATRDYWWKVNIGAGNGLVPLDNEPLPEPMLTKIYVAIWRH